MAAYNDTNFRQKFIAFTNATTYPMATISMWWNMSLDFITSDGSPCSMLSGPNQLQDAIDFMCAHLLQLINNQAGGGDGMGAGDEGGFVVSSTIKNVTVQKLAPPVKDSFETWLYGTPYGQALLAMLSIASVGGLSVGGLPERFAFRKVGGVFF